jgi:hypothetical protein
VTRAGARNVASATWLRLALTLRRSPAAGPGRRRLPGWLSAAPAGAGLQLNSMSPPAEKHQFKCSGKPLQHGLGRAAYSNHPAPQHRDRPAAAAAPGRPKKLTDCSFKSCAKAKSSRIYAQHPRIPSAHTLHACFNTSLHTVTDEQHSEAVRNGKKMPSTAQSCRGNIVFQK